MFKKFILISSILFFFAITLSAQEKTEVLLKYSQQEGLTRIVFETEETYVSRAKITTSASKIKIEFPGPFNLTTEKKTPFELVQAEKSLDINLEEKSEIKFFRLPSPARLVFDIQKKDFQPEKQEDTQQEQQQPEKQPERQMSLIPAKIFVIDAGHGGYDFGITYGNISEKDITLNLARDLRTVLLKKGKTVFLVRRVDQYVSLSDRIHYVNQKRPDIFISLHTSMSENFVLYIPKFEEQEFKDLADLYSISSRQKKYIENSNALSESIGKAIKEEFETDVIRRQMPLPILNSAAAPCVLLEVPSQKFLSYDQQVNKKIIDSIINGLSLYGK
jgi:N-acetylmuramoyl-L-alanine amidase